MKKLLCLLCALVLLCGCAASGGTTELTRSLSPSVSLGQTPEEFAAWQTDFALRLFLREAKEGKNVLISPLSVYMALALAESGANGQTLTEMEALLGGDPERLNAAVGAYLDSLSPDGPLSIANSVWVRNTDDLAVRQDYLQKAVDYFDAEVFKASFDDTTVRDINGWVSKNTDGTIEKIIESISPDDLLYLINTLLFDAEWAEQYTKAQQKDGIFHASTGVDRTVTMMFSSESIYLEDGGAQGFIKPYKGNYAFAALLPPEGMTPEQYIATLTGEKLTAILKNAKQDALVNATLPKFSYDYSTELSEVLKAGGMPTAFDPTAADFSGIADGLYIAEVLHKTHITVDACGTKAGAATSIALRATGMPTEVHTVTLDRPFVYLIIDTANTIPLFIGTVNDIP